MHDAVLLATYIRTGDLAWLIRSPVALALRAHDRTLINHITSSPPLSPRCLPPNRGTTLGLQQRRLQNCLSSLQLLFFHGAALRVSVTLRGMERSDWLIGYTEFLIDFTRIFHTFNHLRLSTESISHNSTFSHDLLAKRKSVHRVMWYRYSTRNMDPLSWTSGNIEWGSCWLLLFAKHCHSAGVVLLLLLWAGGKAELVPWSLGLLWSTPTGSNPRILTTVPWKCH